MNTLTVIREQLTWYHCITKLTDNKGHVKAIIEGKLKQPKYGAKKIEINRKEFTLDWSQVELPSRAKKELKTNNLTVKS